MTHAELNQVALRWLRRPERNRGPGCLLALSEVSADGAGERADAWGYRFGGESASVVVEVKISRADFLRDKKKRHRQSGGFGDFRYFMCPEGVITLDDLPEGWGLLWVTASQRVKVMAGHVCVLISEGEGEGRALVSLWRHDCSLESERQMLSLLVHRIGDAGKVLQERRTLQRRTALQSERLRNLEAQYHHDSEELEHLRDELQRYGLTKSDTGREVE